jgi:hypothetical protein
MKPNPLIWLACHACGVATGWSLISGEPWRQTATFGLVWLVALAVSYERTFNSRRSIRIGPSDPSLD